MERKLQNAECLDVEKIGTKLEDGTYELSFFEEDVDYCVASSEAWIWSIGRRYNDNAIFASKDTRFYNNPDYECLWLR